MAGVTIPLDPPTPYNGVTIPLDRPFVPVQSTPVVAPSPVYQAGASAGTLAHALGAFATLPAKAAERVAQFTAPALGDYLSGLTGGPAVAAPVAAPAVPSKTTAKSGAATAASAVPAPPTSVPAAAANLFKGLTLNQSIRAIAALNGQLATVPTPQREAAQTYYDMAQMDAARALSGPPQAQQQGLEDARQRLRELIGVDRYSGFLPPAVPQTSGQ